MTILETRYNAGAPESIANRAAMQAQVDELRALGDYLGETDGVEMERGLLAYAFRRDDAQARPALDQIYETWGWGLPAWV